MVVGNVRGRHRVPRPVSLSFADHFSTIASRYATYRPRYPQALAGALAERCTRRDLAWDAGCGNGQLSVALAEQFEEVIATEPSQAQIDAALAHPRVTYRKEPAEKSTLGNASVDLAVAAQAAHWFDWPGYVAEVERVARPGALVALVSYGILHVQGEAGRVITHYYRDVVGPYWPPGRRHVENGYRDLAWPWPPVEAPAIDMTAEWTRDELAGYVTTWSATVKLVDTVGPAPFEAFQARLAEVWPAEERRTVTWPLALRFARR
ncbi:MAG TPA: class I SAM-dependent methyltransferase [Kofleriaceae bacterium]